MNIDKHLLLGCIYVPPEGSKYADADAFEEIESELLNFSSNDNCFALIGDFNAKTKTLQDFVIPDDDLIDILEMKDNNFMNYMYDHEDLVKQDIPLYRNSQCQCRTNNFGLRLIEFCKRNNLYIPNGRICDDKEGKRTCNDLSVIDYFILKSDVFTLVKEFKIMDFDPSLSDVHCGIHISLSCTDTETEETIPANSERFHARWQQEKCDEFVNNTNIDNVENISEILRILDVPNDMVSKDIVDSAVDALGKIFLESANKTFGEYSKTVKTNVIRSGNIVGKNKPWFNKNCKEKRNFFRARKRYNLFKNQGTKADMNSFSKEYKRALYDAYGKYQKDFANDIRKMSKNNPKSF